MENSLLVFVSSVIDGMAAERQAVRAAIQAIPLSRRWLFEFSPASSLPLEESCLSKVGTWDIFALILKDRVTELAKLEVETATDAGKPRLVFLWEGAPSDVSAYVQSLGVKYSGFAGPDDLAQKAAEAVGDELITGYRRHNLPRNDLGGIGEFLDMLAAGKTQIDTSGGACGQRPDGSRFICGRWSWPGEQQDRQHQGQNE